MNKFKVGDKVYVNNPEAISKNWKNIYNNANGPFILIRETRTTWTTNVSHVGGGNFVVQEKHLIPEEVYNSPLYQTLKEEQ